MLHVQLKAEHLGRMLKHSVAAVMALIFIHPGGSALHSEPKLNH